MFQPDQSSINWLASTNSEYLLSGGDPRGTRCEIRDVATGIVYATAFGGSEPDALINGIDEAKKATRPKTASQNTEAEIQDLRAKLEAATIENLQLKKSSKKVKPTRAIVAPNEDGDGGSPQD